MEYIDTLMILAKVQPSRLGGELRMTRGDGRLNDLCQNAMSWQTGKGCGSLYWFVAIKQP